MCLNPYLKKKSSQSRLLFFFDIWVNFYVIAFF